jgi:hypothetical protein
LCSNNLLSTEILPYDGTCTQERNIQQSRAIELGAGTAIPSVKCFSASTAVAHRALLIRINPRDFRVPPDGLSVPQGAAEGIKQILGKESEE